MGRIFGVGKTVREVGGAVGGVAEIFVGNKQERDEAEHKEYMAAVEQFGGEFAARSDGWFDRFMNGLNRVPRPLMTIGTLALFVFAMVDPTRFSIRMDGLALVPDPLWWLLGAIVSFYFGSRELHYFRQRATLPTRRTITSATKTEAATTATALVETTMPAAERLEAVAMKPVIALEPAEISRSGVGTPDPEFNAAIAEWQSARR